MRAAARSFGNVLKVLADAPDDAIVTAGPGVTVTGLRELARMHLEEFERSMRSHELEQRGWRRSGASGPQRLSQRPVSGCAAGQDVWPVMVLGIGKERYGIDLPDVAEVLPPVRATPVPGAAAVFAGVINVHGEIRPVIDLRRLLGIGRRFAQRRSARVILLRKDGREMGLQIDSVEQIRWIGSRDLQSAGKAIRSRPQHIKGSTKDLLMLLSTEALFAELTRSHTRSHNLKLTIGQKILLGYGLAMLLHGHHGNRRVPEHATACSKPTAGCGTPFW